MKRLAPLLLLFLLTACSGTAAGGRVQATQGADDHRTAQNAPEAATVTHEPRRSPTADAAAILAIMELQATQTEKAEQRHWLNETSTMQALANQYTRQAQTEAAPQATARAKEQARNDGMIHDEMTRSANSATWTYVAPREAATAAVLRENVKWAPVTALAYPLASLTFGLGVLMIAGIMAYAIFAPRKEAAPEAEPQPKRVVFVEENTQHPIPDPPGEYSQFLVWARAAIVSGYVSYRAMVGAGKPFATNEAYKPLWEWAKEHGISEERDGRNVLSTRGRDYCGEALRDIEPPSPDANNAESMAHDGNAHDYNGRNSSGGVIADPFGVLPKENE